jgi:hypothetical protein
MSCSRLRRELVELFRFGGLDVRSAPHLDHLAACRACRDEVGFDRALVQQLRVALAERVATAAPSPDAWSGILARAQAPESWWRAWLRAQSMVLAGRLRTATAVSAMALAVIVAAGTDVAIEVRDPVPGIPSASDLLAEQYERGPTRLVPAGIGPEEAEVGAPASSDAPSVGQPEFGVRPGGRVSRPVVEEEAGEEETEELVGPAFVIRPRPSGLWADELRATDTESGSAGEGGQEAPAPRPPLGSPS